MPPCTIAEGRARGEADSVSYDQTPPPPAGPPPPGYAPVPAAPPPKSGTNGWVIAFTVVLVLALGGLAAAIISKGDEGKTTATPTVTVNTTTVQNTKTVTTQAPPANVTVAPNVTLNSSGAPEPAKSTTGTTSTP
jgi:hypothetical protein